MAKRSSIELNAEGYAMEHLLRAWVLPYMARIAIRHARESLPEDAASEEVSEAAIGYLDAPADEKLLMFADVAERVRFGTPTDVFLRLGDGTERTVTVRSGTLAEVPVPGHEGFWLDGALYASRPPWQLKAFSSPLYSWLFEGWMHAVMAQGGEPSDVPAVDPERLPEGFANAMARVVEGERVVAGEVPDVPTGEAVEHYLASLPEKLRPQASEDLVDAYRHLTDHDGIDASEVVATAKRGILEVCKSERPDVEEREQTAFLRKCLAGAPASYQFEVHVGLSEKEAQADRASDVDRKRDATVTLEEEMRPCAAKVVETLVRLVKGAAETSLAQSLRSSRPQGDQLRVLLARDSGGTVSAVVYEDRDAWAVPGAEKGGMALMRLEDYTLESPDASLDHARAMCFEAAPYHGGPKVQDVVDERLGEEAVRSVGGLDPDVAEEVARHLVEEMGQCPLPPTEALRQDPVAPGVARADDTYVVACIAGEMRSHVKGVSREDAIRFAVAGELPSQLQQRGPGRWRKARSSRDVYTLLPKLAKEYAEQLWGDLMESIAGGDDGFVANSMWREAFVGTVMEAIIKEVAGPDALNGHNKNVLYYAEERLRKRQWKLPDDKKSEKKPDD